MGYSPYDGGLYPTAQDVPATLPVERVEDMEEQLVEDWERIMEEPEEDFQADWIVDECISASIDLQDASEAETAEDARKHLFEALSAVTFALRLVGHS
jgi:hypothetical protein